MRGMKIYVLRWKSDVYHGVKAYETWQERRRSSASLKRSLPNAEYEIENYNVKPTQSGIVEFFNYAAWHEQKGRR